MRSKDTASLRIIDLWSFKSTKSHKRYIVEVEGFDNEFYGIKFYWKGVESSPNRYSILTHDYEPRVIVRSCIEIMMHYYRRNPLVSFGFVAAHDLDKDIEGKKRVLALGNRIFRFYQKMMLNLFGPKTFLQASDTTNTIYLMINNLQLSTGAITISELERKINSIYAGEYTLTQ